MPHNFAYRKRDHKEYTVYEIDTDKAHLFGTPWRQLGAYGKRKFENLIIMRNPRERIKFSYPL